MFHLMWKVLDGVEVRPVKFLYIKLEKSFLCGSVVCARELKYEINSQRYHCMMPHYRDIRKMLLPVNEIINQEIINLF